MATQNDAENDGWTVNVREKPIANGEDGWTMKPRSPVDRRDFTPSIERAAKAFNVDPLLIRAIIARESGGRADAQGPDTAAQPGQHASGLMQLMPGTAKDMGVTDPLDADQNIWGGTKYLRMLIDRAGGNIPTALLHYVGGRDPKNWGAQSFAYPHLVLDEYRKLGGRQMDPALPQANFGDRVWNAILPFDAGARLRFGKGPDLSQGLSGPDANLPVGAKLKAWLNSESPARTDWHKVMANYQDANPLLSLGADALGALPAGVAMGGALNKGLGLLAGEVPSVVAPWVNFLAGTAGRGAPLTGEGASLGVRALSGAANGALQGAVGGAANAFLQPGQSNLEGAKGGAIAGGLIGGALPLAGAAINRVFFGKRIDPTIAQLGQEARAGDPGVPPGIPRPAVPLHADLEQANQLALDPQQFSRSIGEMIGAPTPFTVEKGRLPVARTAVGQEFDKSLPKLHAAIDRPFMQGLQDLIVEAQGDPNLITELDKMPAVKKLFKTFTYTRTMENGIFPGTEYQELIRQGKKPGMITRLIENNNPTVSEFGSKLRTLLDEAVDRGAAEKIQMALQAGDIATAEQTRAAYAMLQGARQKWKMIDPIEKALDPVTQRVVPERLYAGAEKIGGPLEQLGRTGLAFSPNNKVSTGRISIPYTAAAAAGGMATGDPVTTGKAALSLLALNKIGQMGQHAARLLPGYEGALLRRSSTFGPGPMQSALRTLGVPAGAIAANNPLTGQQVLDRLGQ